MQIIKYFVGVLFVIVIFFALMPKISGSLKDVEFYCSLDSTKVIPVSACISKSEDGDSLVIRDNANNIGKVANISEELLGKQMIYHLRYSHTTKNFIIDKYESQILFLTFPFIPGLEDRSRIILFHVPVAWVSVLGFLVSMFYAIRYLWNNKIEYDYKSANAASLGFLFCILATVTGSIWAKFSWGSFWNWDPRETSIFMLLLIYMSYFSLRSAVDVIEKRAKLSSVYSIIAFVTVPFFIFILPRITAGLHPSSADDANKTVIKSGMSGEMKIVFYLSLLAFTLLFFWIFELKNRITKLEFIKKNN